MRFRGSHHHARRERSGECCRRRGEGGGDGSWTMERDTSRKEELDEGGEGGGGGEGRGGREVIGSCTHIPNCPFLVSSSSPLMLTVCSFCFEAVG